MKKTLEYNKYMLNNAFKLMINFYLNKSDMRI